MRLRSPWLRYLAFAASGGLFGFAWLILLMRDVNQIERRNVFPVRVISGIFLFGFPACLLVVFYWMWWRVVPPSWALFSIASMAIALDLILFVFIVRVSLYASRALGRSCPRMDAAGIVVLTILAGLSFIVLQRRMNILVERASFAMTGSAGGWVSGVAAGKPPEKP